MRRLLHPALRPSGTPKPLRRPRPEGYRADPRIGLMVVLVSVTAAVLVALVVIDLVGQYQYRLEEVRQTRPQSIVVPAAATPIPMGRRIEERDLHWVSMPASLVADSAARTIDAVVGRVATANILPGDLLREERLADVRSGDSLSAVISTGLRAELLDLDTVSSVSGFIEPGNRVDVLTTLMDPDGAVVETRTLVRDVRVLAVDDRLERERIRTIKSKPRVLLELEPGDAQGVTAALAGGQVRLVLNSVFR